MNPPGMPSRGEVLIYQAPDGGVELDVHLEQDTLWLNLNQLSSLFSRDKSVISRHLNNVLKEGELEREAVVAKFATTAADGKTYQVEFFSLDAIISVGYRVNSRRGTQFRIWATQVLRDHLVKGYSVNRARLRDLGQAVRLIADTAQRRDLAADEARALRGIVGGYNRALALLDDYDHRRVSRPSRRTAATYVLHYEEALRIVDRLRQRFGGSDLFGVEKDQGLASALGAIVQTFGGENLYPDLEEKAAHLLVGGH